MGGVNIIVAAEKAVTLLSNTHLEKMYAAAGLRAKASAAKNFIEHDASPVSERIIASMKGKRGG